MMRLNVLWCFTGMILFMYCARVGICPLRLPNSNVGRIIPLLPFPHGGPPGIFHPLLIQIYAG